MEKDDKKLVTKDDFVLRVYERLSKKVGGEEPLFKSKNKAKEIIKLIHNEIFEVLAEIMKEGKEYRVLGFGTFKTYKTKATVKRNPRTGEQIEVPSKLTPKVVFSSKLKELLNSSDK